MHPLAGKPAPPEFLPNVAQLVTAYYAETPNPDERRRASRLRHLGTSRLGLSPQLQRGPRARDRPGDLRLPRRPRSGRSSLSRHRHPRPLRARAGDDARGPRGKRRRDPDRLDRRLHSDPGRLARDSHPQPGKTPGSRRRHRPDPVAQSSGGRRLQVQPAERRSRRHRRDRLGGGASEPPPRRRTRFGEARAVFAGPRRSHHPSPRLHNRLRLRSRLPCSSWRSSAESASASIRSGARGSSTGGPSPSATGSTWRW